jgi:outer membrane lipoprotein SlyB
VTLTSGQTVTFAQNLNEGDQIVRPGQRVMVQTTGNYMRVLPADQLPTDISRPKGIAVHD